MNSIGTIEDIEDYRDANAPHPAAEFRMIACKTAGEALLAQLTETLPEETGQKIVLSLGVFRNRTVYICTIQLLFTAGTTAGASVLRAVSDLPFFNSLRR